MKTVIFGSRSLKVDVGEIRTIELLLPHTVTQVISGMAKGIDTCAVKYANCYGIPLICMPALWDEFGKKAGLLRNIEMCKIAEQAICIWDGKSTGTKHMLNLVQEKGIPFVLLRL